MASEPAEAKSDCSSIEEDIECNSENDRSMNEVEVDSNAIKGLNVPSTAGKPDRMVSPIGFDGAESLLNLETSSDMNSIDCSGLVASLPLNGDKSGENQALSTAGEGSEDQLETAQQWIEVVQNLRQEIKEKDALIHNLMNELEMVKEFNSSNPSTLSIGTGSTDYRFLDSIDFPVRNGARSIVDLKEEKRKQSGPTQQQLMEECKELKATISFLKQQLEASKESKEDTDQSGETSSTIEMVGAVQRDEKHEVESSEKTELNVALSKLERSLHAEARKGCMLLLRNSIEAYVNTRIRDDAKEEIKKIKAESEKFRRELEEQADRYQNAMEAIWRRISNGVGKIYLANDQTASLGPGGDAKADNSPACGESQIIDAFEAWLRELNKRTEKQQSDHAAEIKLLTDELNGYKSLKSGLEKFIQSSDDNAECPVEFHLLQKKIIAPYLEEIVQLKSQLNDQVVPRQQAENSTIPNEIWAAVISLFRRVLEYLDKNENLNDTLAEEVLKGDSENVSSYSILVDDNCSDLNSSEAAIRRSHFAPKALKMMSFFLDPEPADKLNDISAELVSDLDICLERLNAEANAILAITSRSKHAIVPEDLEEKLGLVSEHLLEQEQQKADLMEKMQKLQANYEDQLQKMVDKEQALMHELDEAKHRINDLVESGHREVVSEGYGEARIQRSNSSGNCMVTLLKLQDKARTVTEKLSDKDRAVIEVVEELLQFMDDMEDKHKKDEAELMDQIKAVAKKLGASERFIEDQAHERELERDENQKIIADLESDLKEKVKELQILGQISNKEAGSLSRRPHFTGFGQEVVEIVEKLEKEIQDMSELMRQAEGEKVRIDDERRRALAELKVVEATIGDITQEKELQAKEFRARVAQLEQAVGQQAAQNEELHQELEAASSREAEGSNHASHIARLEDELYRMRLSVELVGTEGAAKQIKNQLSDLENTIEKRTKELEAVHFSAIHTNCSSPSEEMSLRDQIRPSSPSSGRSDSPDLPLQQLARLKEKLIRHSRAEDAAVKKIRDLELQLVAARQEIEDAQAEKDVLAEESSKQLVLISSLQMRLDEQRLRVETVQKQANSSLENKIYSLESKIKSFEDTVRIKDKKIKQLENVLKQTEKKLKDQEGELSTSKNQEMEVNGLRAEVGRLKIENGILVSRLENSTASTVSKNLTEILASKNADIDMLKESLEKKNRELQDVYSASKTDFEKSFEYLSVERLRKEKSIDSTMEQFHSLPHGRNKFHTTLYRSSSLPDPMVGIEEKCQSTPYQIIPIIPKISSHPQTDQPDNSSVSVLRDELQSLKQNLDEKNEIIKRYESQLTVKERYEKDLDDANKALQKAEELGRKIAQEHALKAEEMAKRETDLRIELAAKKVELSSKENELELLRKDAGRKDQMFVNTVKEKRELQNSLLEAEGQLQSLQEELKTKQEKLDQLQAKISQNDFSVLSAKLQEAEELCEELRVQLVEKESDFAKKEKDLKNLSVQTDLAVNDAVADERLKALEADNRDKKIKLETLAGDNSKLEAEVVQLKRQVAEKDLHLVKQESNQLDLNGEIEDLQSEVRKKDKIIHQMGEDCLHLREALQVINDKVQAAGSTIDLTQQLHAERQLSKKLKAELSFMKKTILRLEASSPRTREKSIEEIADQLRKQLDYSAALDSDIFSAVKQLPELVSLNITQRSREASLEVDREAAFAELMQRHDAEHQKAEKFRALLEAEKEKQIQDAQTIEHLRQALEAASASGKSIEARLCEETRARLELENRLQHCENDIRNRAQELIKSEVKDLRNKFREKTVDETLLKNYKKATHSFHLVTSELENARSLIAQLAEEKSTWINQIADLKERERKALEALDQCKQRNLNAPLPIEFERELRELRLVVSDHLQDNQLLTETISKFVDERAQLLNRIKELENADQTNLPFTDPKARVNHLFRQYLKLHSQNKSLVWQKKYLMCLIAKYSVEAPLVGAIHQPSRGKRRFKIIALTAVIVQRMKFIVRRWHLSSRRELPASSWHLSLNSKHPTPDINTEVPNREGNVPKTVIRNGIKVAPLDAHALLSQYADRFSSIHERLGQASSLITRDTSSAGKHSS